MDIKISVRGAEAVLLHNLEPFQGDLKALEREQYEKLRNGIMKMGFSFVVHVWRHEGKNYIIDGHQRIKAVKMMVEKEGFACPPIPISLVEAKDFAEAKRKVLAGASQYGRMSGKSLKAFLDENDIPFDETVATYDFAEIDFEDFSEEFYPTGERDANDIGGADLGTGAQTEAMKVGSDGVRQLPLFFAKDDHEEFLEKVNALKSIYHKENVTDVVIECVREAYNRQF